MAIKQRVTALATGIGLALAGSVASANVFGDRAQLETLSGIYQSSTPESWYGGFGTRTFSFEAGKWGLSFVHALDPDMKIKTFRFRTEGPYQVETASKAVPGAFEAVFYEDVKYVTLLTGDEDLIKAFGFSDCGLELNVEVDISAKGCASWKPVAECGEDHDLLAIDGKDLYFGVRPGDNDMCSAEKRPTALLQPVVRK